VDKKLLEVLQEDFPVCSRPFKIIAEKLGLTEEEVLKTLKELKNLGIIRHFGASLNSRKLGYFTCLCAVKLPKEKLNIAEEIASLPEVTHGYLRDHELNFWFTTVTKDEASLKTFVKSLEKEYGVKVLTFPAVKQFKVKAVFKLS